MGLVVTQQRRARSDHGCEWARGSSESQNFAPSSGWKSNNSLQIARRALLCETKLGKVFDQF